MATILVLGGGTGGIVASHILRKRLGDQHQVILIDRNNFHTFYAPFPLAFINKRRTGDVIRNLNILVKKRIRFIQTEVMRVIPDQARVETKVGPIQYDYLVIALGAEHHPETLPGFSEGAFNCYSFADIERIQKQLIRFEKGKIVLFISSLPFICPPAPYEIIFLLDYYFRKRGLRSKVQLTLVTPETSPEPLAGALVGAMVRKMLKKRKIRYISQAKILSLDPKKKVLNLDHGVSLPGDIFLGVPPTWGPTPLRGTDMVQPGGWITVDPYSLRTQAENVFAIGDANGLELPTAGILAPKSGIFAHYQGEVVAKNIALTLQGRKPKYKYTGKGL